jgi:NAD(P)-dependent dehydrogenase (short-subunit alcohol dehydrogenase family)
VGDIDRATEVTQKITASTGVAEAFQFDMGDAGSSSALVRFAVKAFGRLDGLYNVAHAAADDDALDHDLMATTRAGWEQQLSSHLVAYGQIAKPAIALMLDNGGGSIVNTASAAARSASAGPIGCQTANAGVETLTRHIAARYGKLGVRCNCIAYGVILTEHPEPRLSQQFLDEALRTTWSPRLGRPEDVAGLAALLLSEEGAWINGQVIDVNGGRLLGS